MIPRKPQLTSEPRQKRKPQVASEPHAKRKPKFVSEPKPKRNPSALSEPNRVVNHKPKILREKKWQRNN